MRATPPADHSQNSDEAVDDAGAESGASSVTYLNPVLDADFPDPSVIRAGDGFYYAYATQSRRDGKWINIQVARSADLVDWQHLGDALPIKPDWARRTQDFWAPSVIFDGQRYWMYYSARPGGSGRHKNHALAVATSDSPAGPFIDMGQPLWRGSGFEFIDPMAFDDPATGKRLLYWGSGFQPIKVQELAPDRMAFAPGSAPVDLVWPNPVAKAFPRLVEAAWVHLHDGFYYLFYSGDNCCGRNAEYGVMVARSTSATGPFETLEQALGVPHSLMLFKSERWLAPGHNAIALDAAGDAWIIYHAIDADRPRQRQQDRINSRRILLIDRIEWRDGWPFIGTPSDTPRPAPASEPLPRTSNR
ncbi:MAG: glycoside hydrolase family 43 protein [Sphingomicrobium sp.]